MTSRGVEGLYVETHNWGKAVKFFQALGYQLEFETDHNSGQLRNGDGPYLFVAEVPEDQRTGVQVIIGVDDAATFEATSAMDVITPFQPTHWGTEEMTVRDPDGRIWSIQAPGTS